MYGLDQYMYLDKLIVRKKDGVSPLPLLLREGDKCFMYSGERVYILFIVVHVPAACAGDTVDVETATSGTDVGPIRGTYETKQKQRIEK